MIRDSLKSIVICIALAAHAIAGATDDFIAGAKEKHGEFGEKAARFLVEHMPENDKNTLTAEFLTENLDLAIKARGLFPWAKAVPEEIFFNDVLPYAVFDEPRDPWRAEFIEKAAPIVKDAKTATEAAQLLNRDFFKLIKTHYNTKRERTNQSPKESMAQGRATCTGLSIILVDVCRAVGIPARAVGTPMWWDRSGNHTWVEIWDGDWHFTGADEYNAKGLNRGWFVGHASKADENHVAHAIYATSWKRDQGFFPLVWAPQSRAVGAVNVTQRYQVKDAPKNATIGVRFFEGEERRVVSGSLTSADGSVLATFETKAGTADMNDTPRLAVKPGESYRFRITIDGKELETDAFVIGADTPSIRDLRVADLKPVAE